MFAEDEQLEVAGGLAEWLSVCVEDLDIVAAFACEVPEFPGCDATSVSQPADSAWCQHLIQQLQQGFEGGGLVEQVAADDDWPGGVFGAAPVQQLSGEVVAVV